MFLQLIALPTELRDGQGAEIDSKIIFRLHKKNYQSDKFETTSGVSGFWKLIQKNNKLGVANFNF